MPLPLKLSQPTGSIALRAFDIGIYDALGAVIRTELQTTTLRERVGYWIDEIFTAPTAVPVIFNNPEQIYENKIYPSYLVRRNDISPSLQRWHSIKNMEYWAGVSGFHEVSPGVSGYSALETKPQAYPYDIFYTIIAYARYEHEAVPMAKRLMKSFPPYGRISVIDSLGQTRVYTVFNESGVQDIGDIVDVADRLKSYSIDIRVEGEIDTFDTSVIPTMETVVVSIEGHDSII
jgi:hypothetical protein